MLRIFLKEFFYFMGMGTLPAHVCMYDMNAWYLWRPEKGIGSLELELHMVVNHHLGTGN